MNAFEREYLESLLTDDHDRMAKAMMKSTDDELRQLSYKLNRNSMQILDYMYKTSHLRR